MKDDDDNVYIIVMKRMSVYVLVAKRKEEKMREKKVRWGHLRAHTPLQTYSNIFFSLSILTYSFNKQKHCDIVILSFSILFFYS
jgi:hypothetical protein